jgi:hypothetical protein
MTNNKMIRCPNVISSNSISHKAETSQVSIYIHIYIYMNAYKYIKYTNLSNILFTQLALLIFLINISLHLFAFFYRDQVYGFLMNFIEQHNMPNHNI